MGKAKPKTPRPKAAPKPTDGSGRKVLYPTPYAEEAWGKKALTVERMKELLGWTEDAAAAKAAGVKEYHVRDRAGKKIYLLNNVINRPFYQSNAEDLVSRILRKRWAGPNGNGKTVNGETVIIGRTGLVLNGQHQMVAGVLAEQDRTSDTHKFHWAEYWDGPVVLDKLVFFGADESDDVVDTMDTAKPRTLADVIYRSPYFRDLDPKGRETHARFLGYAVKKVWNRTGAGVSPYSGRRTTDELMLFIGRHPSLVKALKHVVAEYGFDDEPDSEGRRRRLDNNYARVKPGDAAAMLYLMAAGASDGDEYRNADPPSEKELDLSRWDKAEEFWTLLLGESPEFREPIFALNALTGVDDEYEVTTGDRLTVLALAWAKYIEDGRFSKGDAAALAPPYHEPPGGTRMLAVNAKVGGIDLGDSALEAEIEAMAKAAAKAAAESAPPEESPDDPGEGPDEEAELRDDSGDGPGDGDPSPEEIEAMKKKIKTENGNGKLVPPVPTVSEAEAEKTKLTPPNPNPRPNPRPKPPKKGPPPLRGGTGR